MTGNVHYWIVVDAVEYVRKHGTEREAQAFQAWESAWGGGNLDTTAPYESRIEDIVGHESARADYYHDLTLSLIEYSGSFLENRTDFLGLVFTAFNHFLAVPWKPTGWKGTNGYRYGQSAMKDFDWLTMTGLVDYANTRVYLRGSPILAACQNGWARFPMGWQDNWNQDIRHTIFVPASVLASHYYDSMLDQGAVNVVVNGKSHGNAHGLFLLGPVAHAIADACVPHHIISTLGNWHQVWENVVETGVSTGAICLDCDQVYGLLRNHMKRVVCNAGKSPEKLAVDKLVHVYCGWKTYKEFLRMNELSNVNPMQSWSFWLKYLLPVRFLWPKPLFLSWCSWLKHLLLPSRGTMSQTQFFYNLAVAGTVRVITESYYDLVARSDGSMALPAIQDLDYPTRSHPKKRCDSGKDALWDLRPDAGSSKIKNLFGLTPLHAKLAPNKLNSLEEDLHKWNIEELSDEEILSKLKKLEENLEDQYGELKAKAVKIFPLPDVAALDPTVDQLRTTFALPSVSIESEPRASFGPASFRPPAVEEYMDPGQFAHYLKSSRDNELNARLIGISRSIALQKVNLREAKGDEREIIEQAISTLEQSREQIVRTKKLPVDVLAPAPPQLELVDLESSPLPTECEESDPE